MNQNERKNRKRRYARQYKRMSKKVSLKIGISNIDLLYDKTIDEKVKGELYYLKEIFFLKKFIFFITELLK